MLTPTLKKTAFLEKGVLTPDEFVRAGDELVYRCPTWSWCGSSLDGGGGERKSYLPADKQYLMTRNVPCRDRVATLEQQMGFASAGRDDDNMLVGDNNDGDDDWMVPTTANDPKALTIEDEFDVLDENGEVVLSHPQPAPSDVAVEMDAQGGGGGVCDDDNEYADMADFEDDNVLMEDDVVAKPAARGGGNNDADDDHIVKVRTYDLSITYDKYYQTPRIWMSGKTASGDPLTAKQTMEDVMTDYANKTVTMEAHPHIFGIPHASIHPCQHGKVMKTIVRNLIAASSTTENGAETSEGPSVEMYLFIFLKFVSSIIPTINYDFTMDVTADTSKN